MSLEQFVMTEEVTHIVLEHLLAIHADLDEMKEMFDAADRRLAHIEISISEIRSERATNAKNVARLGVRVETLSEDIDCIKRYLDIID